MPALKPVIISCLAGVLLAACTGLAGQSEKLACQPIDSDLPWGALSGLAADTQPPYRLYAVHDHNLSPPEILVMDTSGPKAVITHSLPVTLDGRSPALDLEGIARRPSGGFWLVSEGKPAAGKPNLLLRVDEEGKIEQEIPLPPGMAGYRVKAGLEGVSAWSSGNRERVAVVFQRRWKDDPRGQVKIGLYSPAGRRWQFFRYPLDAPKGTGLSAVSFLPDGSVAVLERDNRPFHKARIKRIYRIRLPRSSTTIPLLNKELLVDLLSRHPPQCGNNGKLEGMTVVGNRLYLVADDDGDGTSMLLRTTL